MRAFALISCFLLALQIATPTRAADNVDAAVAAVAHHWAAATYATPENEQPAALESVLAETVAMTDQNPQRAEPKVWQAITLAGLARVQGGLGALGKVKRARELLLEAEKLDADTMDGSIYATLGSLYAKVPGWPIGYGDKKQARIYLDKAIALDPNNIDSNYFYADFLVGQGDYAGAAGHLRRAIDAPARDGRADADAGRRAEAQAMLAMLREKHASALAKS